MEHNIVFAHPDNLTKDIIFNHFISTLWIVILIEFLKEGKNENESFYTNRIAGRYRNYRRFDGYSAALFEHSQRPGQATPLH